MSAEARYADQYWLLERKLADLHGERFLVANEAQRASMRLFQIEQDMETVQHELSKYGPGVTS